MHLEGLTLHGLSPQPNTSKEQGIAQIRSATAELVSMGHKSPDDDFLQKQPCQFPGLMRLA